MSLPETTHSGPGDIAAAMSFGLLAAEFATAPETWPVFRSWLERQSNDPLHMTREHATQLATVLAEGALASRAIAEIVGYGS